MKIAIMTRDFDDFEGPGIAAKNLIDNLLAIDRENSYVLFHKGSKYFGRYREYQNVKEVILSTKSKFFYDQVLVPWASKREHVDLIFNTKFSVPLFSRIPSITIIRGAEYWTHPEFYNKINLLYTKIFVPLYCKKAVKIITLSENLKYNLHHILKIPLNKMVTIYSAPHEIFKEVKDQSALMIIKRKYNLPEKPFVLSVTRPYSSIDTKSQKLYPGKNIQGIVKSFLRLRQIMNNNIHLVMVGKKVKETLYRNGYDVAKLEANGMIFIGPVCHEDMPYLYSMAAVLIFPSYGESFGLPLVEAMACGCPVVTSTKGACPEIIGDAGFAVEPDDIEAISKAMQQVLSDQDLALELKQKGLHRSQDFGWRKSAEKLKLLFEKQNKSRDIANE